MIVTDGSRNAPERVRRAGSAMFLPRAACAIGEVVFTSGIVHLLPV